MTNKKERQQPFHVRRVRLKQSIIKSNQMLENLTSSDNNIRKFRAITEPLADDEESPELRRKHTYNSSMINELDLLNLSINKESVNHMKFAVQMSKNNRYKKAQFQMQQNGLQAFKIQVKPSIKKFLHSKDPTQRKLYRQSFQQHKIPNNMKLKTLTKSASPQTHRRNITLEKQLLAFSPSRNNNESDRTNKNDGQTGRLIKVQKIDFEPMKGKKIKQYLYQKMMTNESKQRDRSNLIYEKRIKSYTDFIWKLLLAHNVFLDLDLPTRWNQPKLKAYIGNGNNCNMIKGLLKRRYWWTITDQNTQDCTFVWSQLKIDKIYERQEFTYEQPIKLSKPNTQKNIQMQLINRSTKKLPYSLFKSIKKTQREKFNKIYNHNKKIWNGVDCQLLQPYFLEQNQRTNREESEQADLRQINYRQSTKKISQNYKNIKMIDSAFTLSDCSQNKNHSYYQVKPIVHNHLPNNYLLGNKKALFYNLKSYYQRVGESLFSYIPLTFHIKNGFKDPQYKHFTSYYSQIKLANRQSLEKEKNIWIVKPGQNSNRGNGIIVIDQIYELDNIIKKSEKKLKRSSSTNKYTNDSKISQTFIVQKYIQRPFLYYDRKFDIRHYMLMTNLYGITRAYWYQQGYIRTSSYPFNVDSFQPQIHLTNDAVQKDYTEYGKFEPFNKISYNEFQNYLSLLPEKKLNFKEQILPQMKKMAADAAKSVYLKIAPKQQMHNFEIFGLDFMIDRKFKPWLIQINTNPCLDCECLLLNRIIPYMVEQSLKLSLDLIYPPPSHYPSLWKHNAPLIDLQTFKYELIFDSVSQGEGLKRLFQSEVGFRYNVTDIGEIEVDECYRDDGKEIKLQDFT